MTNMAFIEDVKVRNELKQAIQDIEASQSGIALEAGISQSYVSTLLNGKEISNRQYRKFLQALETATSHAICNNVISDERQDEILETISGIRHAHNITALNKSLDFYLNSPPEMEKSWENLYLSHEGQIRSVYISAVPQTRLKILEDLIGVAEKYSAGKK